MHPLDGLSAPTWSVNSQLPSTVDQVRQLLEANEQGVLLRDLANMFKVHRVTVAAILRRHGIAPRARGLPTDQIPLVAELYEQGLSAPALGQQFGVDGKTVWNALPTRQPQKRSTISPDNLLHRGLPSIAPPLIARARLTCSWRWRLPSPFCLLRIISVSRGKWCGRAHGGPLDQLYRRDDLLRVSDLLARPLSSSADAPGIRCICVSVSSSI